MDRSGQFVAQYIIDQPLPRHSRKAFKLVGNNQDAEMGLAALPGARMARMKEGLILNLQP